MAYARRGLFFFSKYFRSNTVGLFPACKTRKLCSAVLKLDTTATHFYLNVLLLSNIERVPKRLLGTQVASDRKAKHGDFEREKVLFKFKSVNLESLIGRSDNIRTDILIGLFCRMYAVYHLNKSDTRFLSNLHYFVKTEDFKAFCTLLEKQLPKLKPDSLALFLNLSDFRIPTNSSLMRKIVILVLDNFNCYSLENILDIYLIVKQDKFKNSEEAKKLLQTCELYFTKSFETELSYCINFDKLIEFLFLEDLSLDIKMSIAKRFIDYMSGVNLRGSLLKQLSSAMFNREFLSFCKHEFLPVFIKNLQFNATPVLQGNLCLLYRDAVCKCNDYYDENVCKFLVESIESFSFSSRVTALTFMETLCLVGYFSEKAFDKILTLMLETDFENWQPNDSLTAASIFARVNFHEMENSALERVRNLLLSYDAKTAFSENLMDFIMWTQYLTFLGCDTRPLLSQITEILSHELTEIRLSNKVCRSLLQLHHFAKEYFVDGYTKFSDKMVENFLQNSEFKNKFYNLTYLKEFFGGDNYLIKNCTNSHQHFIPLAVIFGPDNKPIELPDNVLEKASKDFKKTKKLNIDKIPKPPGSKVIVFMGYSDCQPIEFRNAPMMSGAARIFLKSYQKLPHDIVLLNINYTELEPTEKIQYLKSQIQKIINKSELQT